MRLYLTVLLLFIRFIAKEPTRKGLLQMPDIGIGYEDLSAPAASADDFLVAEIPAAAIKHYRALKAERIRAERAKRNLVEVIRITPSLAKRRNTIILRRAGYARA